MKQYNRSGCPDSTGQQHIPYVEGRVDSVDNGIFIHAIVPRHIETVALLESGKVPVAAMSEKHRKYEKRGE